MKEASTKCVLCAANLLRQWTEVELSLCCELKEGLTDGRSGIRATGDKGSVVQTHFFPVFTPKENRRMPMEIKETEGSEILEQFACRSLRRAPFMWIKPRYERKRAATLRQNGNVTDNGGTRGHKEETAKPTEPIKTDKPNSG